MRRTLILSLMVASSMAWANPVQTFSQGSLIIPMQGNFQSECGAASAYGLIWKILYENRSGGAFSGNPVQIYWVINDAKSSPNRCVPSNRHTMPLPNAGSLAAGKTGWDLGPWNDGCDFSVENASKQPVVLVNWASTFPTASPWLYATGTIPENNTNTTAIPYYDQGSVGSGHGVRGALDNTGTCTLGGGDDSPCGASRFTKIQYMGGVFVIDSSDAKRVINTMQNGSYPYFATHTSATACPNLSGAFKVNIHQSTTSFDAPVYKRITNVPSRLALVDIGSGVSNGILQKYLNNAGLSGTINSQPVAGTTATPGLVYDMIRALDDLATTGTYPNGYLNSKVAGKSRYKVFWAPHWELNKADTSTTAWTATTNAQRADALGNIAWFGDQKGNGIMAECASIEGYEGGTPSGGIASYNSATNFMFSGQIKFNGLGTMTGRNCTDPSYVNGSCTKYAAPGDAFSQIGDFSYSPVGGHVQTFRVNGSGGTRRVGVERLATSWKDFPVGSANGTAVLPAAGDNTGDNGWDYFTLSQKDNDPEKATIIYIAGHDLTSDAAGTRVVLNTLLNLGADPLASDRSFTEPVGFIDNTTLPILMSNTPTLVSSVYGAVIGTLPPGAITYSKVNGKNWMWPFTGGNLRGRNAAVGLNVGINELNDAIIWNADAQMPLPADRNLFTYFGGVQQANPALSGARTVKNGVAQLGWVPARLESTKINATYSTTPNANCVDVMQFGDYKDKVSGVNTGALVAGADGICDIQQAIQWSSFTWAVNGSGNHSIPPGHLMQYANEVPDIQQFIQRVRGYCFALDASNNPVMTPTDAQCVNYGGFGDNRAHMGGAVRSTAAIVPDSARIQDNGAPRPTVAYVGTWDGQLHAFYVGGGSGYTGPTGGRQYLNPPCASPAPTCPQAEGDPRNAAASTFKTDWSAKFATGGASLPTKGTELWSFLPATQLPWLTTQNARVDSSPVVQDAFIDLFGDGVRRWHTILVVSVGGTGREIFAFDVTNPLQPVLLWDLVGSNATVGSYPAFAGTAMANYDIAGNAKPLIWDNTRADYTLPPAADPGRTFGQPFDYTELGGSRALAIGQLREGLEPTYAVFVSSNSSGYGAGPQDALGRSMAKGLVVHAIDLATGQKLWQWHHPYVTDSSAGTAGNGQGGYRLADNTVPPPVTMRNGTDGASTLLVGDMEGRMWELDAATGMSLTALRDGSCLTTDCNFPLFDTQGTSSVPQPITSNIAIAKMPGTATGPLAPFVNDTILVVGTSGTDWVPSGVAGKVHTLLLENNRRIPTLAGGMQTVGTTNCLMGPCTDWTSATARAAAQFSGVLQEPTPLSLTDEYRVYGNINIAGQVAYVPLVSGQGGDPMSASKTLAGKTLELDLGAFATSQASAELANFNLANFGGVAVFSIDMGGGNFKTRVIGDQISNTSVREGASQPPAGDKMAPKQSLTTNTTLPYRLYNTVRRFLSQQ